MPGGAKPLRKFEFRRRKAPLQVKNLAARIAMEVVVMLLAGHFVARCITGDIYRLQPFLTHQILNVSIDRGNSQASMMTPGSFQSFFGRQRSVRLEECLTNRRLLSCIALFHS